MIKYNYKCEFCGTQATKRKERNYFHCKNCNKYTKAIPTEGKEEEKKEGKEEEKKEGKEEENLQIKTEQIKIEIPTIKEEEIKKNENENIKETQEKTFSDKTITKYFETINTMMRKKATEKIWDITKEEEELLGDAWAEWANEKYKGIDKQSSRLAVAALTTITIYTPRIFGYLKAIYEQKKRKQEIKKDTQQKKEEALPIENMKETSKWIEPTPLPKNLQSEEGKEWMKRKI
ncbi:MAG: hypothetical protein ABIM64_04110 [candidate division WOR-3 bacterium]